MHNIRPYQLFTLVQAPPSDRAANVQIPARRAAGGVTLLETFAIIAALRIVAANRVFEFGTFFGSTTLNLALNIPNEGEVLTLDLGEDGAADAEQDPADVQFTRAHLGTRNNLDFMGSAVEGKITMLTGDSTKFDFTPWADSVDLTFIDGGHDLGTVRSDSENALRMARTDRPSSILWHDYHNADYPALTDYLDNLSQRLDIFHIGDTMLCLWFNDLARSTRSHLLSEDATSAPPQVLQETRRLHRLQGARRYVSIPAARGVSG
jgi:hypothetical protein